MQYTCWCCPFGNAIIWRYTICCQLSDKETSTIVFVKGPKVERLVERTFCNKEHVRISLVFQVIQWIILLMAEIHHPLLGTFNTV